MTINEQLRTLSNPVRFKILTVLKGSNKVPASTILEQLDDEHVSVNQLSQHLTKLRLNQLITAEKVKGRPHYTINQKAIASVLSRLEVLGR